jgi:hypothetical protein
MHDKHEDFLMDEPRIYAWQRHYEAALGERDPTELSRLVAAAQASISARVAEIHQRNDDSPAEMRAIEAAQAGLRFLIQEIPY